MTNIRQLNVFIASPGDVPEEREIVREVCEELNKNALCRSVHSLNFHAIGWEDAIPAAGRPQEIINKLVEVCDIFVCLFFRRLGTPSGKKKSGTLEEFLLAYDQWKDLKKPHILFYFKDMNINSPKEFNDPQVKKVVKLREKIEENRLLLFDTFDTPETFRKKLRDHLEGWIAEKVSPKKSKKIQKKPPQKSSAPLQIPTAYRLWLIDQCQYMDLQNLMDKGKAIRVELPEVFIPLYTDPQGEKNKKGKEPGDEERKPVDIEELAAESNCLLIEGQAGSGKTTLLKHLAYTIIKNSNLYGFAGYLPVLVFLKDLQIQLKEKGTIKAKANALEAERFLGDYLSPNGLDMETVKGYCRTGKTVFLLDGLDELEPGLRDTVIKSLAGFRAANHDCRMVLSGRPHGIDNAALNHFGDHRARINSLNMPQVERFINSWFDSIFHKGSQIAERTAGEMIGEVRSHESVAALINNPLMLTAVCILYYDNRRLPDQRADLYKMFVDNLIHRRFTDPERIKNFLIALAYQVHNTGKRGFSKDFALKILGEMYCPREQGETERDYKKRLGENKPLLEKDFNEVEQNCGLLKLEKGQYDFWHLTFQEFLAARYIATKRFEYIKEIKNYWDNNWYKEVIELLIGFLSIENQGWANRIVREELEETDPAPFRHWRLASQSLLDIHKDNRDADVVRLARQRLNFIIKAKETPKIRAEAGEILGWLGDPRTDLEEFVKIEGGDYDLEELGKANLKPFEIGKYPVTNQWFGKFIQAGGYKEENWERYWTPEGRKWVEKERDQVPRYWHERQWNCPNAPVVGVSWWEADAFCRWLTEEKKDGFVYRLPTDQEWQAAAAGKEGREYPWGSWEKGRCNCNTRESGIGKTSAVGIFANGNTPEGVADMSGNVREWIRSDYDSKLAKEDFTPDEWGTSLRGGSWLSRCDNAGCADPFRFSPFVRSNNIGFRCARTLK